MTYFLHHYYIFKKVTSINGNAKIQVDDDVRDLSHAKMKFHNHGPILILLHPILLKVVYVNCLHSSEQLTLLQ